MPLLSWGKEEGKQTKGLWKIRIQRNKDKTGREKGKSEWSKLAWTFGRRQATQALRDAAVTDRCRARERPSACFTFLKKGIRFSRAKGDITVFGLTLGERWWGGGSLSSRSNPAASMSTATYTYINTHTCTYEPQQNTQGNSYTMHNNHLWDNKLQLCIEAHSISVKHCLVKKEYTLACLKEYLIANILMYELHVWTACFGHLIAH